MRIHINLLTGTTHRRSGSVNLVKDKSLGTTTQPRGAQRTLQIVGIRLATGHLRIVHRADGEQSITRLGYRLSNALLSNHDIQQHGPISVRHGTGNHTTLTISVSIQRHKNTQSISSHKGRRTADSNRNLSHLIRDPDPRQLSISKGPILRRTNGHTNSEDEQKLTQSLRMIRMYYS